MNTSLFVCWFLWTAAVWAALQLIDGRIIKSERPSVLLAVSALRFLAASAIAYLIMAVNNSFSWNCGYPLGALYIALMAAAAADTLRCVIKILFRSGMGKRSVFVLRCVLTAALLAWGTLNMQNVSPVTHTYISEKIGQEHIFVFIADLHYGSVQTKETVEDALEDIRELGVDFIVLGGDITDEFTSYDEMVEIWRMLRESGIPTYYVYGNHDRQENAYLRGGASFSPKELEETILSAGITVLRDEWVYALEDVVLVGREDVSSEERLPLEELPPRPEDACVIWIDHTPYQEEEIASSGADLQLSGHSHAGQLFPLRTLYRLGVRYIWGDYDTRGAHVYVTSGFGGWYIPFRTEKTCCYDVITLKPSQP